MTFKEWYDALCKRYSVCYDNYEDLLQEAFEAGAAKEREALLDTVYSYAKSLSWNEDFQADIQARDEA